MPTLDDIITEEENDEFLPFLSSTENEFTDLNTDFNTDRVGGEESGPASTYRRLNSKRNTNEKQRPVAPYTHIHS